MSNSDGYPLRLPAIRDVSLGQRQLSQICDRWCVRRLGLFGSATTDRFDPAASDLDFLVDFAPLAPGDYARAYFGLREELQSLFGREVDLVTESSIANPYFRRRVESERQTLFERT
ncbi:MAG TPA: nucleotidyltransferase domain-containing protein [Rhizomicrobium sp.]|nr:nucleotidyltransferase domain-containing protein [Rhizomicrobium sp.]